MAIQTRLEDMVIGDKIVSRFHSGGAGTILYLGSADADPLIPGGGLAPGGSVGKFYFIYVGDDFKGRRILVADRNVMHSISWDSLNTEGYSTKDGVQREIGANPALWKTNIRLLTGRTVTTANSEWDKYIVNGPVGNSNSTWNWSGCWSWTSSTGDTKSSRIARGNTTSNGSIGGSGQPTSSINRPTSPPIPMGFRPVLVAESLSMPKETRYLISKEGSVLHHEINPTSGEKEWITLPETVLTKDLFLTHGMTDLSAIPEEAWAELGTDFEILCFKEEASPLQVKVTTETLYDEVNQRYQGTGKAKVEEATLPAGVKQVVVQAMYENTVFTLVREGVELGVIEPGTPFEVPGQGKVELYAELTAGVLDAVSLAWM